MHGNTVVDPDLVLRMAKKGTDLSVLFCFLSPSLPFPCLSCFILSLISVLGTPTLPPSCPDMQQCESYCCLAASRDVCGQDESTPLYWPKLRES